MQPELTLIPKGIMEATSITWQRDWGQSYKWDPLAMEQCWISTEAMGMWT